MDERLSKHELIESERGALTGYFKVRHPEESFYWFQVSYAPGVVTLSGDVGCLMFYHRNLQWLLESIDSPHYLMQSVPQQFKVKERSRREAVHWLEDSIKSEKSRPQYGLKPRSDILRLLADARRSLLVSDADTLSEDQYHELLESTREFWVDEPPCLDEFTMQTYWQLAALRCFERLYRTHEQEKAKAKVWGEK
jgi:hypothetical protein